ncbi:MAG: UTRA domain-containing protein [Pseudonocardiaceae bacterium]
MRSRHLVRRDLVAGLRMEYERAAAGDDEDANSVGLFEAATGTESDNLAIDITYDSAIAEDELARILGIAEGATLLRRTFRYIIEGTPHQLVTSYMTRKVGEAAGLAGASSERAGRGTIAQLRGADIHVDSVTIEIEARLPTATEVHELAIPPGVPVFAHRRVMQAAGQPVEISFAVVPGDRVAYTLNVELGKEVVV